MGDKENKSDSNESSISESIEAQFDDLFAPGEFGEITDTVKKSSAPDTPPAKKVPSKKSSQKPLNKKVAKHKAPVSKKKPSASGTPSAKAAQKKFTPNKTIVQKVTPSVKAGKHKPPVKQDTSVIKKDESSDDTEKAVVQNVFQKANQKYNKNELWDKAKQYLIPLLFIFLLLLLVMLSMFIGKILIPDGMMEYFNLKNKSTSIPAHVSINHTNKRKVSVSKAIKNPSPEKSIEVSKAEKTDILESDQVKEETENQDTTDTIVLVKTADEPPDVDKEEFISYPFSVYLGSYNSIEKVETAVTGFTEKEITTYWIKLDLGEKGIWFRHFAGYFKTRKDADEFIKARQLKEAESRLTKYTNLIGIYGSREDINRQKARLEEQGYCPYIISDRGNVYRLYAGAFYQKGRAEELKNDLEFNGIKSELVER